MKNRVIAALVAFGALALSACSNTQKANPCTAWVADNGAYIVKYTVKPGDEACAANQVNINAWFNADPDTGQPAAIPFDGNYSDVSMQLYVKGSDIEVDLLPWEVSVWSATSDGTRADGTTTAAANFDSPTVGDSNECTVASTSTSTTPDGEYTFKFTNLRFLEDANAQGTEFTGEAEVTNGGCTAHYTVTGIGPEVGCASNDDCLPVPDLAAGRPFSSGIASELHTYCDLSDAAQLWEGSGICFPAEAFPSVCPNGQIEGGKDSSCNAGK